MHSLEQLNSYSNLPIVTGDERPTSITTTPSPPTSLSSTIYSTEDVTHNMVIPFTIDTAISINATFTVNVAMYAGATVTWPTHDANLTYTNPSTGVYQVSGITGLTQWTAQNHPTVYMGPDRNGSLTYTANITGVGTTISWYNNAILAATGEINTGTLTGLYYDEDVAVTFDSGLLVTDVSPSGTYSIAISKSDVTAGTLSSTGSGGTSNYAGNVLTIAGTKAQVNSHLANITFTPTTGFITDFTLTYAVTNVSSSQINYAIQSLLIGDTNNGIMNMHLARSYTENLDNDLFVSNIPTITETNAIIDANTALLLHADDFIDSSNNAYTGVNSGVVISTTNKLVGTGSFEFSGDYAELSYTNNSDLCSKSTNFTFECWVNPTTQTSSVNINRLFSLLPYNIFGYVDNNNLLKISIDSGNEGAAEQVITLGTLSIGTWYHIAITYNSGHFYIHKDGQLIADAIITLISPYPGINTTKKLSLGSSGSAFSGYIDEIRFSNVARYTATAIPYTQYTISLQLASNIGFISTSTGYLNKSGWNATTLTYTYTGTIVQCNATFADLHFYPTKNSYANAIVTYTQRKNSIFQLSQTFNLTGIADATPIAGTGYITFAAAGTTNWMPTYQQAYYLSCDALVVGPGGLQGSNYVYNTLRAGGGGGGAGALTVGTNIDLTLLSSYQIIVGASGGAYSKFGSIVSNGGGNGGDARGAAGYAPWVYVGGSGGTSATGYTGGVEQSIDYGAQLGALTTGQLLVGGSGGGGNSSIGSISYKGTRYLSPTGNLPLSGYGGHGILNSFTGTSVNYCLGAPGYPVPPFNSPPEPAIMPTTPGSGNQPGLVVIKFYE